MRRLGVLALVVLGVVLATAAGAFPVTIAWTGSIDTILDPDEITPGFLAAGTPVTGVFSFDTAAQGIGFGSATLYFPSSPRFRIQLPNGSAPANATTMEVEDDGDFGFDSVTVGTGLAALVGFLLGEDGTFLRIDFVQLGFRDGTGAALADESLPGSDAQWALLAGGSFQITGCPFAGGVQGYCSPIFDPTFIAFGPIESVTVLVPEPSTALLLAIGLVALRRRSERR